MARLGLIEEDIVLPEKDGFILCDENGVGRVTLLSVIGKGGTAIAYKAIRRRNGSTVTCIVKEYFPEQKEKSRGQDYNSGTIQRSRTAATAGERTPGTADESGDLFQRRRYPEDGV